MSNASQVYTHWMVHSANENGEQDTPHLGLLFGSPVQIQENMSGPIYL